MLLYAVLCTCACSILYMYIAVITHTCYVMLCVLMMYKRSVSVHVCISEQQSCKFVRMYVCTHMGTWVYVQIGVRSHALNTHTHTHLSGVCCVCVHDLWVSGCTHKVLVRDALSVCLCAGFHFHSRQHGNGRGGQSG